MRDFYLDGKQVSFDTLDRMDLLMSDINFLYGDILNARIQATKSKGRTFLYM